MAKYKLKPEDKSDIYERYRIATLRGYNVEAAYWAKIYRSVGEEGCVINHEWCNGTFSCNCNICNATEESRI